MESEDVLKTDLTGLLMTFMWAIKKKKRVKDEPRFLTRLTRNILGSIEIFICF